jgi:hypothetical protein
MKYAFILPRQVLVAFGALHKELVTVTNKVRLYLPHSLFAELEMISTFARSFSMYFASRSGGIEGFLGWA